ncbi:unnamed protein product [Ixodes pacificus]
MSQVERKKSRKKREKDADAGLAEKPSKVEYDVARYLRDKLPVKKTTLLSHKVEYFNAAKAVDCLLESPWATGKPNYEQLFTTRESVVDYMDLLLQHKFFHRAKKIIVTKTKKKKEEEGDGGTPKAARERRARAEGDEGAKDSDDRKDVEEKTKRLKLDMHLEQFFVDANEASSHSCCSTEWQAESGLLQSLRFFAPLSFKCNHARIQLSSVRVDSERARQWV